MESSALSASIDIRLTLNRLGDSMSLKRNVLAGTLGRITEEYDEVFHFTSGCYFIDSTKPVHIIVNNAKND
jgi:hypothetical protein